MNGRELFCGLTRVSYRYIDEAENGILAASPKGAKNHSRLRRPLLVAALAALLLLLVFLPDVFSEDKNGSMLRSRLNELRGREMTDAEMDEQIDAVTERLLTDEEIAAVRERLKDKPIGSKDEEKILARMKNRRGKGAGKM